MAAAAMVDPTTEGSSDCHLFPTTEIFAMLIEPARPGWPETGRKDTRISLMADQLAAVAELIFKGTRTNFHPEKSTRLGPTEGSNVMGLTGAGTIPPELALYPRFPPIVGSSELSAPLRSKSLESMRRLFAPKVTTVPSGFRKGMPRSSPTSRG